MIKTITLVSQKLLKAYLEITLKRLSVLMKRICLMSNLIKLSLLSQSKVQKAHNSIKILTA